MSDEQQTNPEIKEAEATEETVEVQPESEVNSDEAQVELEKLTNELIDAREQVLRASAEVQNIRRRAEQDIEKAHKFGQEKIVADLLPVVDNLERSLASIDAADEQFKTVIEGIELTLKSFSDTLERHKVVAVDPMGEPFDPQLHQAMTMVESPDAEPNTIINVFQKGYTLHGRLVRPAMVVVSKVPGS